MKQKTENHSGQGRGVPDGTGPCKVGLITTTGPCKARLITTATTGVSGTHAGEGTTTQFFCF